MKIIENIFTEEWIETIGWTIFHSIWQAALILIILVIVLLLLKNFSARIRYFVSYLFLLFVLAGSVYTGVKYYSIVKEKIELKEKLLASEDSMTKEILRIVNLDEGEVVNKAPASKLKWTVFKAKAQQVFPLVFALWLLGIIFFLFRMAGGLVYLQRLTKRDVIPFERLWQVRLENIAIALNINKPIEAMQSFIAQVPMIVGYFKPVVLFPISVFTGLSDKEIEAILAHELAHIKRNDYLFNIIQSLIETLLFYHPAVWIISKIIRDEREHSCDELAINATGDKLNYIKALASAQQVTLNNQYKAVAFAKSNGELLTRVKRLKTMNNMKNKVTEGFFAASLIFISLILLSFTTTDNYFGNKSLNKLEMYDQSSLEWSFSDLSHERLVIEKDTLEKKVKRKMKKMEEVPEDLEKVVEVALSEDDEVLAAEILKSVEEAMQEIEWSAIQEEALKEVELEMAALNLDSIVSEAMKEAEAEMQLEVEELKKLEKELEQEAIISQEEALEIAAEAMEAARVAMEAIELDTIIEFSVGEALKALEDLNIGEIITDAMEDIDIQIMEDSSYQDSEKMNNLEKELDELESK